MNGRWNAAEDALLRAVYPTHGAAACARCLPDRSLAAVRRRAAHLGLRRATHWRAAELAILHEHYPRGGTAACQPLLPGRSPAAISQTARIRGLRAPAECSARMRFKPGHQPWNTGRPFDSGGRGAETRFKPGHRPHNWHPIGHERISKEGYLQRKMTDTGCTRRDYVPVHHLLWEQHHGPIPDGHVVAFRNGDRSDIRLENLVLISRADLMARNSIHHLPEPLKRVIFVQARLTRVIGERER